MYKFYIIFLTTILLVFNLISYHSSDTIDLFYFVYFYSNRLKAIPFHLSDHNCLLLLVLKSTRFNVKFFFQFLSCLSLEKLYAFAVFSPLTQIQRYCAFFLHSYAFVYFHDWFQGNFVLGLNNLRHCI